MQTPVEQIKERLGIVDVISSYVEVVHSGGHYKAKCPFHNEKTPSFFVSPERRGYYCFGCGAKGDIFTFVQAFEGLDFQGALRVLAARAGVELGRGNYAENREKDRLYAALEEATQFFERALASHEPARAYLARRGVRPETIKHFRLGFAPLAWRELSGYLAGKKFAEAEIEKAGLAKRGDKGFYDRFRGRVMFPISDSSGRIIGFSGRILEDDGTSAKYLNSPEGPLFDKSSILYGIDKAKFSIRKHNFSVLVEGQMDLVLSHQAGFTNTVASSGTALAEDLSTREHIVTNLGVMRGLSKNVILAFDRDQAGMKAALRAAGIALSVDMEAKIARLPKGKDPADVILESGASAWKAVLADARHVIEFEAERIAEEGLAPHRMPRAVRERILPYLRELPGAMEQAHFVKVVAEKTSIGEDAIWADLKRAAAPAMPAAPSAPLPGARAPQPRSQAIARQIRGIIAWQESSPASVIDAAACRIRAKEVMGEKPADALFAQPVEEEERLEAEVAYKTHGNLGRVLEELFLNAKEAALREERDALSVSIAGEGAPRELLVRYQEISSEIARTAREREALGEE